MSSCRLLDPNLSAESCVAHYVQAIKLFKREKVHEVSYSRESDMRGSTVSSLLSYKCKERRGLVGFSLAWAWRRFGHRPVFSRPMRKLSLSSVLASPMAGSSPILPAGLTSSPMFICPLRNVPVVKTTQCDLTVWPLPETIQRITHLSNLNINSKRLFVITRECLKI